MRLLEGKKALILGIANERSIAWGIAKTLKDHGANLGITYLEPLKERVELLADRLDADFVTKMDVSLESDFEALRKTVENEWGKFDILIHSIAFADKADLKGTFSEISRDGFLKALDISVYSLIGLAKHLKDLINDDGSILAMTYQGSQKIVKGYNLMGVAKAALESSVRYMAEDLGPRGVRVNAISAGPIKTLASSSVAGLSGLRKIIEDHAPLRQNITIEDVGKTATYLSSELSSGVTGQIIYVDSGASVAAL